MKDDAHGAYTPEMMKLSQATWIETFPEGVTDKSTGLLIFKVFTWFVYKVSGLDGKTGLVPDVVPGFQDWKCPGTLVQTWH